MIVKFPVAYKEPAKEPDFYKDNPWLKECRQIFNALMEYKSMLRKSYFPDEAKIIWDDIVAEASHIQEYYEFWSKEEK